MEITNLDAILARESYLCVADTDHPFKMFPELSFSLPVNATHQFNINIPPQVIKNNIIFTPFFHSIQSNLC